VTRTKPTFRIKLKGWSFIRIINTKLSGLFFCHNKNLSGPEDERQRTATGKELAPPDRRLLAMKTMVVAVHTFIKYYSVQAKSTTILHGAEIIIFALLTIIAYIESMTYMEAVSTARQTPHAKGRSVSRQRGGRGEITILSVNLLFNCPPCNQPIRGE
jgi:hypothetical protein